MHEYDVLETEGEAKSIGPNKIFAQIELKDGTERNAPQFISRQDFNYAKYASGLAIGIRNREQGLQLVATPFKINEVVNLELPQSAAVLLFNKESKDKKIVELVYGFYENLENQENGGEDYFLHRQFLQDQAHNEIYIDDHKVVATQSPHKQHPYNSIGYLFIPPKCIGTASLLLGNKSSCRFIITCAHNFYDFRTDADEYNLFDNRTQLQGYKLNTAKEKQYPQRPSRYLLSEVEGFKIKNVYIPKEYIDYVSQIVQKKGKVGRQQISFPPITYNQESVGSDTANIERKVFHDIAIAELETPLDLDIGFRIKRHQKPFNDINKKRIEVAGFPKTVSEKNKINTTHKTMYHQSTQYHDLSYARLSDQFNGVNAKSWRVLKHKLSTLGGNSGSPIYEKVGSQESYLFGIHTSAQVKGNSNWGYHNFGTYIYSQNIKQWLFGIPGIEQVVDE